MTARRHLLGLTPAELAEWFEAIGEPSFRGEQLLTWVYRHLEADFRRMSVFPQPLRDRLDGEFAVLSGSELERVESPDGTIKVLLRWPDGASTESVMIPARSRGRSRTTACLSTQVGCGVGCRFCASGLDGVMRDLSVGEVIEQAWRIAQILQQRGRRLSNVVYMGMGEPLANYQTTVESVRRLNADWNLHIGQRRITISTVGLPKQIERLAEEGLQATLALSLHAADDALRAELIPWARGVELERLLPALRTYFQRTGREITFEYCLLAGVNDRPQDVTAVAKVARDLHAAVNLLMYNPVAGLEFRRPSRNQAIRFLHSLRRQGVSAHLRESRGLEGDAACGQLRRRREGAAG